MTGADYTALREQVERLEREMTLVHLHLIKLYNEVYGSEALTPSNGRERTLQ